VTGRTTPRSVVLLRGVNVGRNNRIAMSDLRRVLEGLGAADVVTYLQSGNAVVTAEQAGLAERIEKALRDELGLDVRVLVRSGDELARVIAANPYAERTVQAPKSVHVAFLDAQPDPEVVRSVGTRHGEDEFTVGERVLYLRYAATSHDSPLNKALRGLGGTSTARNWTTVTAMDALVRKGT
jgi:uncharacterized protein (DUF1697 family)